MSLDNSNIRNETYSQFSKLSSDDLRVRTDKESCFPLSKRYEEVWEVNTGLYDEDLSKWLVEELSLFIAFTKEFPYDLPRIYLNPDDFHKIGFVPHLTYWSGNICVSDEFVIVDESKPLDIISFQLEKAKKTLIEGLKKENLADFNTEFVAYWDTLESDKDKVEHQPYLSLIDKSPKNFDDVQVVFYRRLLGRETKQIGVLFNKTEGLIQPYLDYFDNNNIQKQVVDCFFIGQQENINTPPFSINCEESLEYIPAEWHKDFKKFFNKTKPYNIVVFEKSLENSIGYYGWRYLKNNSQVNGFRQQSEFSLSFHKYLPNHKKKVVRFSTSSITKSRLFNRTASSNVEANNYKLLVAGLGSVGSILTQNLNSLNFPSFTLVDNDNLNSENIGRHLLGFDFIGQNKALAMQKYLGSKLPSQNVKIYDKSVIDLFQEDSEVFNNQDYIFLATGKINLDRWFIERLIRGDLRKPLFILWVEPYLIGGQCLYLHPNNGLDVDELFMEIYKYKHSVIDPTEFEDKRELFTLKESGCQSTYSPYSNAHLVMFMSAIHIEICKILESKDKINQSITWIGDTNIANKMDIKLSVEEKTEKYSIIKRVI